MKTEIRTWETRGTVLMWFPHSLWRGLVDIV